jgi:hypothetical protein
MVDVTDKLATERVAMAQGLAEPSHTWKPPQFDPVGGRI